MADLSQGVKRGWGFTLILFGILFFLKQLNVMPSGVSEFILDWHNYPFYAAAIFFAVKELKPALVLMCVGILFHGAEIIELTKSMSHYLWPLFLVGAGVLLLVNKK